MEYQMNVIPSLCMITGWICTVDGFTNRARNGYEYETHWITQNVDHFGFKTDATFQMRYLVNKKHWGGEGKPIFFYTGNEGDITWFCNNTGFMWDIAEEFNAALVFAEHRYYGESLPFGNDSYKDPAHLNYLTAEQALADFAVLIDTIKTSLWSGAAINSPVVAFGGSYGGMLAAWFRMKYPASVVGSLAASAPVLQFTGLTPCESFNEIVTDDFREAHPQCPVNIRKSWDVINKLGATESGRVTMEKTFRLCQPLKSESDIAVLKDWLSEMYGNLAMVDYPYPANFLEPLPAWPIQAVCKHLSHEMGTDKDLLMGLYQAVNVYFNYTGKASCFNTTQQATGNLGDQGWGYQYCTEMVMPLCSNGKTDMFEPNPWNLTQIAENCKAQWGVTPRPRWIVQQFGGKNIQAASNIIFSNGRLDPWRGGGVVQSVSSSVVSIVIHDGAHHLDLRSSNPADPPSVKAAREQEKAIIRKWIQKHAESFQGPVLTSTNMPVTLSDHLLFMTLLVGGSAFILCGAVLVYWLLTKKKQRQKKGYQCLLAPARRYGTTNNPGKLQSTRY